MSNALPDFLSKETFRSIIEEQGGKATENDYARFDDFIEDAHIKFGWSFLSAVYLRFRKLFQEKGLWKGFLNALKSDTAWEEKAPPFSAFWEQHKIFDALSTRFGNVYRGSFILNYLLGALAVAMAMVPIGFAFEGRFGHEQAHHYALLFTGLELVMILSILCVHKAGATPHGSHYRKTFLGVRINRRWHERWLEYRLLAERLRYMEVLYPLGINPLTDGAGRNEKSNDWINWTFALCLTKTATKASNDVSTIKKRLKSLIESQSSYHKRNAERNEHIHHHLHQFASWLFFLTLAACAAHFVWHNPILTFCSAFFPALAAAFHGIIASGEFQKIEQVSAQMHISLTQQGIALESANTIDEIKQVAIDFHNIVISEAQSWKAVFNDKNVPLA